jgi:hypothetical protein
MVLANLMRISSNGDASGKTMERNNHHTSFGKVMFVIATMYVYAKAGWHAFHIIHMFL